MSNLSGTSPNTYFPVPAAYFGMVLGLVGLGSAWRFAALHNGMSSLPGEGLMALGTLVWAALSCVFVYKWLFRRDAALAEVRHPVQGCCVSLFPCAGMLVGLAVVPYSRSAALWFIVPGAIGQLAFAVWRSAGLLRGRHTPEAATPAQYLPAVAGNLISAITLGSAGCSEWGVLFLGAGFFAWLSLESTTLARLRTLGELPAPQRPLLGIQIAPPLVACTAYLAVNGGVPDLFAQALYGYGLLQLLFMIRLWRWIFEQPFSPAFWSFSFGIASLAAAGLRLAVHDPEGPFGLLAPLLFLFANLVIGLLILATLLRIFQGRFVVPPPSGPCRPVL